MPSLQEIWHTGNPGWSEWLALTGVWCFPHESYSFFEALRDRDEKPLDDDDEISYNRAVANLASVDSSWVPAMRGHVLIVKHAPEKSDQLQDNLVKTVLNSEAYDVSDSEVEHVLNLARRWFYGQPPPASSEHGSFVVSPDLCHPFSDTDGAGVIKALLTLPTWPATLASAARQPPQFSFRHHTLSITDLTGAPPDAPLPTNIHRVTSDNRRVHTQTILVQPTSPVKRARIEHLERQRALPSLLLPEDTERYDMGLDGDESGDDIETEAGSKTRQTRPADPSMDDWAKNHRDAYLRGMLWREGRGQDVEICGKCGDPSRPAIFRCLFCHGQGVVCETCCLHDHHSNPLHYIEKWNGVYFVKSSLHDLGLHIQFGHHSNDTCPYPRAGRSDFVVIADNGIHSVAVNFCGCMDSDPNHLQLLKGGWYPATTDSPRTAATFTCLDRFHYLSLHGKTTAYDYYAALESLTDGTGIKPPDRYAIFMRMSRQYRHLLLLKRMGRGHDRYGVLGTGPGELALRCPACPRPGVNLPEGWENAPPEKQCMYVIFIALDACFRLKRRAISNELRDPGLGTGWAYMLEWHPYTAGNGAYSALEYVENIMNIPGCIHSIF
ncbi:CxC2 domain-containing protein [Mycena indigotica]|uniref:CxC2 domain-containing protein n=1 Tax=Mycena indigotica TaxID=2126181 RepID=A0A8H6SQJ7_9AGAR|nr:CxC2 domain-containing protein [Mycena indigotica]KAF7304205.1 CxC2 domain-containing protein [Mycena indigotica]